MKKIILYLFLVTFISCDHYEKINNRFHELLTDYVFHDDVYMTERAPITISKSYENYYIVVSGEHKDEDSHEHRLRQEKSCSGRYSDNKDRHA